MHFLCGLGVSPGKISGKPITFKQYKTIKTDIDPSDHLVLLIDDLSFETISELILEGNIHGIIAERGGICSHGATLAREAKLPCVVNILGIKDLTEYQNIQIDGTTGEIGLQR